MAERDEIPVVISIAGSDSGGGAGIQADLKALARCGVHGTTAITAITAQSTVGVTDVHPVPPETIRAQIAAVAGDIGIDAVKVGMLGSVETIEAVVAGLEENDLAGRVPIVVDPVMVAESGATLLDSGAASSLAELLLPLATVATPNLPEARELAQVGEQASREQLAEAVLEHGPAAVLITGGHTEDGADLLLERDSSPILIEGAKIADGAAHGSGCTHSSVLAAQLAIGLELIDAARIARELTVEAIGAGLRELGQGPGPVDALATRARWHNSAR